MALFSKLELYQFKYIAVHRPSCGRPGGETYYFVHRLCYGI